MEKIRFKTDEDMKKYLHNVVLKLENLIEKYEKIDKKIIKEVDKILKLIDERVNYEEKYLYENDHEKDKEITEKCKLQ